jgi:hypothetical protein
VCSDANLVSRSQPGANKSEPSAIPITVELHTTFIAAVMPLPHSSQASPPTLTLKFYPPIAPSPLSSSDHDPESPSTSSNEKAGSLQAGTLRITWELEPEADEMQAGVLDAAIREGVKGGTDVVEVLRRIEAVLRG